MNKTLTIFLFIVAISFTGKSQIFDCHQGQVEFFSYTKVENIKAVNNQAQGKMNISTGQIAVQMLMNTFIFEKSLMKEHFNESYIESDLYPHANFDGEILDFVPKQEEQTKVIKGSFELHGAKKDIEFKVSIVYNNGIYTLKGDVQLSVKDYNIKIPSLLSPNIADAIAVNFNLEFESYEN